MILTHGSDPSQVALTLDDGPSPVNTLPLLRVLAAHKAKATFFMLGKWVQLFPYIVHQVSNAGHDIGNHTMNHRALADMPINVIENEIAECQREIINYSGVSPQLFRPPYGQAAQTVDAVLSPTKMCTVMWSQLSGDWAATSTEEIVSKINLDTDKGEIVLLHDGSPNDPQADRSHTVEAVEIILQKYSHKSFVTVSQLTLG